MARISIRDLPRDMKISEELMAKIQGGAVIGSGFHLFRQESIWSMNIYQSGRVEPPPPTPSGRLRSDIRE
jgi:hypothetical protein